MIIMKNGTFYGRMGKFKEQAPGLWRHTESPLPLQPYKIAYVRTRIKREHQKKKAGDLRVAGSWVFSHIFIRYCLAIKINWKHFQDVPEPRTLIFYF